MVVHQIADMEDLQNQLSTAQGKLVVIEFFAKWPNARKPFSPRSLMLSEDK